MLVLMSRSLLTFISNPTRRWKAAKWVEKVRVNPGNYADKKKFEILEYTDEQYAGELQRIEKKIWTAGRFLVSKAVWRCGSGRITVR